MNDKKEDARYSFESSTEPTEPGPRAVKLDGNRSRFAKQVKTKQNFEKIADAAFDKMQDRQQKALEMGAQFINLMKDKTLVQNKTPTDLSIEKEILSKLITFNIEVNNDEMEAEGMGSTVLLQLLFSSSINLRNKCNQLEYRLEQLEKQILKSSTVPANHDK